MARFDEPAEWRPPSPYGPLDALYEAVRRHAPAVTAACVRIASSGSELFTPDVPDLHMRVSYGQGESYRIVWDADEQVFRWQSGPDAGAQLGPLDKVDQAAQSIAHALGAPTR